MSDANLPLVDLVTYLRVFSNLISVGVNLINSLGILTGQITDAGLREAHLDVMRQIEEGTTLSQAMMTHPELFSGFLIYLVRAGEVGGVLDVTMERAADFYEKRLMLRRDRIVQQAAARVMGQSSEQQYEAAMAEAEPLVILQYFCYMFGTLLASGVPILQAMQTAAEVLPEGLAEAVRGAAKALRAEEIDSLAPSFEAAGFPPEVTTLTTIGWECGALDRTMLQAGDVLGARVNGLLLRALGD